MWVCGSGVCVWIYECVYVVVVVSLCVCVCVYVCVCVETWRGGLVMDASPRLGGTPKRDGCLTHGRYNELPIKNGSRAKSLAAALSGDASLSLSFTTRALSLYRSRSFSLFLSLSLSPTLPVCLSLYRSLTFSLVSPSLRLLCLLAIFSFFLSLSHYLSPSSSLSLSPSHSLFCLPLSLPLSHACSFALSLSLSLSLSLFLSLLHLPFFKPTLCTPLALYPRFVHSLCVSFSRSFSHSAFFSP